MTEEEKIEVIIAELESILEIWKRSSSSHVVRQVIESRVYNLGLRLRQLHGESVESLLGETAALEAKRVAERIDKRGKIKLVKLEKGG